MVGGVRLLRMESALHNGVFRGHAAQCLEHDLVCQGHRDDAYTSWTAGPVP